MFDKIYKDENKFSSIGNNFKFKIRIFFNKCRQVGLPPNVYIYDASIMLYGQAQTYTIMPIAIIHFFLNNYILIYNYFLRAPNSNILT